MTTRRADPQASGTPPERENKGGKKPLAGRAGSLAQIAPGLWSQLYIFCLELTGAMIAGGPEDSGCKLMVQQGLCLSGEHWGP